MSRPHNLDEWADYISELVGQPLFSQAVAANSQDFANTLIAEGMSMADVEKIMLLFVRQLRKSGTKVPSGGAWDLVNMAQTDPVARRGATMDEMEVALMESRGQGPVTDDFDMFEREADFEG